MTFRRIAAGAGATAAILAGLAAAAPAAQASGCYEVGFERTPNVVGRANPPSVSVDDGDPYWSITPGSCF